MRAATRRSISALDEVTETISAHDSRPEGTVTPESHHGGFAGERCFLAQAAILEFAFCDHEPAIGTGRQIAGLHRGVTRVYRDDSASAE